MSLLAAAVLLCALALPAARPAALPGLYRVQSLALAVAAAWQGMLSAGCLILAFGGLLLPPLLRRAARREPPDEAAPWWQAALGVAIAGLAAMAVMPAAAGWPAPARLDLALALAVLLAGLLGMLERRPLRQAVSWLSAANGVALAGVAVADPPLADAAALALPALAAAMLGALYWRGESAPP